MSRIWKLGNAFLQSGRSSLICCDVRYCWNQILNVVSKNRRELKASDVQSPEEQLKFKKCSNSEPSSCSSAFKNLFEPWFLISALNALNLSEAKAHDDCPSDVDNDPLLLEALQCSLDKIDLIDLCDVGGCKIKSLHPDVHKQDHILYSTRASSGDDTISNPTAVERSNLIKPGGKPTDGEDKSYIINIFLNNRKASEDDSINVCLKDLEIKADDICMQKLMSNIQKNYPAIDQICQSSGNFEECKTRLSERLEKVWRNVLEHSKTEMSKNLNEANVDDKIDARIEENKTVEQGQNRVNIIVNYEDKKNNETEQPEIAHLSGAVQQIHEKNIQEIDKNENLAPLINAAAKQEEDRINNETKQVSVITNLAEELPKTIDKKVQEESKNENLCVLTNADAKTDEISNEYIKKKLEMVEEKIAALTVVHEVIKQKLNSDYVKLKNEENELTKLDLLQNKENGINESAQKENDVQILASNNKTTEVNAKEEKEVNESIGTTESVQKKNDVQLLATNNKTTEVNAKEEKEVNESIGTTESVQKKNDVQLLATNNKITEVTVKEENVEIKDDSASKRINVTSQIDVVKHERAQEKNDVIAEDISNAAIHKECEGKYQNKTKEGKKSAIRGLEECPAIISASACELINDNTLNVIDAQLQNKKTKTCSANQVKKPNPSLLHQNPLPAQDKMVLKPVASDKTSTSPAINQVAQPNPSLLPQSPPPVQEEMVLKSVSTDLNKELLEKFIIQEHINRNLNRKSAKKAKENKITPKRACFRQDCDINKQKLPVNNVKPNSSKPKFQIKDSECTTSSVFKRTSDRLQRYNVKQLEQIDSIIKLASAPTPQNAVTKMMRFCRSFFKDDEHCLQQSIKNNQQEDYIDRRLRGTKLCSPDHASFNMQSRSFMPNSMLEITPRPVKSDTKVKGFKSENEPSIGSMNRTEEVIHHQKMFQQKCGIRERMLPFSGGSGVNGSQKMSYTTNSFLSIKEKILNIFHGHGRRYSTKDDCHKDDDCCEKSRASAKDACKEEEEDPCAKSEESKCQKNPCAKLEQTEKNESKCQAADPCDEIEQKYEKSPLKSCGSPGCKPRDEEDDDDECGGVKHKCETPAELKKIKEGVLGCTSKCLVNRDPDGAPDPEPIKEPCPKKNDCDSRQDTVVEPEIPKCDIMDSIGHFIKQEASDDVENYYGDNGYKNLEYYKNKPYTFYDINQYLANKRNPQPNSSGKNPPKKIELKRKRKRKIKKTSCTC